MTESQITEADDNIFADLGLSPQEAENPRIQTDLMLTLRNLIRSQDWTTKQAAQQSQTSEDQIAALIQGDIDEFRIEPLIEMLAHGGMKVRLEILSIVA